MRFLLPFNLKRKKRKTKVKTKTFSEEPTREPVAIYDAKNEKVQLSWRDDEKKVSNSYQKENNLRQTSLRRLKEGILRQMYKLKVVCDEDTYVIFRSSEKNAEEVFKTNKLLEPKNDTPYDQITSTPIHHSTLSEELNAFYLDSLSPSKTMAKPIARSLKRDQICAICDTKYHGAWLGCDGLKGADHCNYWVHVSCIGFLNLTVEKLEELELDFYCPEHNNVRIDIVSK